MILVSCGAFAVTVMLVNVHWRAEAAAFEEGPAEH